MTKLEETHKVVVSALDLHSINSPNSWSEEVASKWDVSPSHVSVKILDYLQQSYGYMPFSNGMREHTWGYTYIPEKDEYIITFV